MEDEQIIKKYNDRNPDAIADTSQKYGLYCRSIAFDILRNHYDVEECVNDAFKKVWKKIPPENPPNFKLYLGRIIRNVSYDRRRENRAQKRGSGHLTVLLSELEECVPGNFRVEDEIARKELAEKISKYLMRLSSEQRNMFLQHYWYGKTHEELAWIHQCTVNKVRVTLHRVRKGLKSELEQEDYSV